MHRAVLEACLPWLASLGLLAVAGGWLLRAGGARPRLGRLWRLHRHQSGGVQSLSFVLTLPLFVMVLLLIVQVSQLMIATITVHYAAYATARAASVWIPAALWPEAPNCIGGRFPDPEAPNQVFPILDPEDPSYGPRDGGVTYVVESSPDSPKWRRLRLAAALACAPICPSRATGFEVPAEAAAAPDVLAAAYTAMAPSSAWNARIPARLRNKLAYAFAATEIELRFYHQNQEPPLEPPPMRATYGIPPDYSEFQPNELGWQDVVTVRVRHQLALLPGPGRLLARWVPGAGGQDRTSARIGRLGNVYTYPLSASATMGIEGEKPLVVYQLFTGG